MEQQQTINRLYWLSDDLYWELVLESEDEKVIMAQATHLGLANVLGTVGYAFYKDAPVHMQWTAYVRYQAHCKRVARPASALPKPILLLEMLNETHAGK